MNSEQINTRIKKAVEAVQKASINNKNLKKGLEVAKDLIHVRMDLKGNIEGINVPVSMKNLEPEEGVAKDDRPIGSFE